MSALDRLLLIAKIRVIGNLAAMIANASTLLATIGLELVDMLEADRERLQRG